VPTKNAKGILENLSRGIIWLSGRLALWKKIPSEIRNLPSLNVIKTSFMGKIILIHYDSL